MKIISLENNFQRVFLVIAVVLAIIGISLHNPLGGYDIPVTNQTTTPCSDGERAAYKREIENLSRTSRNRTSNTMVHHS